MMPAPRRDAARLLVISRTHHARMEHRTIGDLPALLQPGDLLVLNNTRVLHARFVGTRIGTGGRLSGLYLSPAPSPPDQRSWMVLVKGGHLKPGVRIGLGEGGSAAAGYPIELELRSRSEDEPGAWIAAVHGARPDEPDAAILDRVGLTPLPPYILAARKTQDITIPDSFDRDRYQTMFADEEGPPGSVAAPTAGLHLTPHVLSRLNDGGIGHATVNLSVGTGTFKPVETEFVEQHPMHAEWCAMPPATRQAIHDTRARGGRVFAVGTTAARTIETYAGLEAAGQDPPESIETRILITPGYQWRWVDGLLTNFHLPRSTLLAMVAALLDPTHGLPRLKQVYQAAIDERYRFFSYGDAMLVLP